MTSKRERQASVAPPPPTMSAAEIASEVARAGVEFEDPRVGYVCLQIDRDTWLAARALGDAAAAVLHPQAGQHELLAVLARTLPARRYLEVGVREGGTLWVVCEAAVPRGVLTLVALADDWGASFGGSGRGSHGHVERLLRDVLVYGGDVAWLDGPSQQTLPALLAGEGWAGTFDLAHVDGDHSEAGCYADLVHCWQAVRPGGAVVVHDATWPDVELAVTRFIDGVGDEPITASWHSGGLGCAVLLKGEAEAP